MPTEPHHDVLYRELSLVQLRELRPSPTTLLQEVVNFGTNAFIRCLSSAGKEENIHLAPFAIYRQLLEYTDGTEIIISNAAPSSSIPLLRSSFEALLALEFILEDNSCYESRSLSWLAGYVRETLRFYKSLIPKTTEGAQFLEAVTQDKSVRNFPLPPKNDVVKAIENLDQLLSREQFQVIIQEYDRHKKEPHWYSLFSGPENIYKLARHLKRTAQYDVLYRGWSMSAHAQDFRSFLAPDKSAQTPKAAIRGLRDLTNSYQVTTFAVTFLIDATRLLLDKYHPGEDWSTWYFREVRDAYTQSANAFTHQ
jgi:hypothetical protein